MRLGLTPGGRFGAICLAKNSVAAALDAAREIGFPLVPAAAANMSSGRIVVWSASAEFQFLPSDYRNTYTAIFDPTTRQVSERLVSNLKHDMFCSGTALLSDGRLLVNGGRTSQRTSIFDPASATWSRSTDMNIPRGYQGTTLLSTGRLTRFH